MNLPRFNRAHRGWFASLVLLGWMGLNGCQRTPNNSLPGYVEGEYVYISVPVAGRLEALGVRRGADVKAGDPLFALEPEPEKSDLAQAEAKIETARATLADLHKGRRETEKASLRAQLGEAEAALILASEEKKRQVKLAENQAASKQERDRAESTERQAAERVQRIRSELETAELGARADQITAAESELRTREAAAAGARWQLRQKNAVATHTAAVHDTLYRQGEWVPAGKAVVILLPPDHIKIRVFVPEARLGAIHSGDRVLIKVDGGVGTTEATSTTSGLREARRADNYRGQMGDQAVTTDARRGSPVFASRRLAKALLCLRPVGNEARV